MCSAWFESKVEVCRQDQAQEQHSTWRCGNIDSDLCFNCMSRNTVTHTRPVPCFKRSLQWLRSKHSLQSSLFQGCASWTIHAMVGNRFTGTCMNRLSNDSVAESAHPPTISTHMHMQTNILQLKLQHKANSSHGHVSSGHPNKVS
jgi:hypothetical protein